MATYYVNVARADDSGDGLSWGAAKKTIAAAVTLAGSAAGGPHTINVRAGTYAEALSLTNANHAGITFVGDARDTTIIAPALNGNCLSIGASATGGTVRQLTLRPSGTGVALSTAANWTLTLCDLVSGSAHTGTFVSNTAGVATVTYCRLRQYATGAAYAFSSAGTGGIACSYNTMTPLATSKTTGGVCNIGGSGGSTWYNNVLLGAYNWGCYFQAGANTLVNNIIQCSIWQTSGYVIGQASTATVTANRNLLIAGGLTATRFVNGTITEGAGADANLKTNADPKFKATRGGFILPRVDDAANFAYFQSVAQVWAAKGVTGTYAVNQAGWSAANDAALRTLVAAGTVEAASHGYGHTNVTLTGTIFTVTKGAETLTVNRAAGTITLSGGGSVTDFKTKTLAQIKTALEALGATVTPVAAYTGNTLGSADLGEVIADGAGVNTLSLLRDATGATGLEKVEITDPKAWMANTLINGAGNVTDGQTGATYVCNTFVFPYTSTDATAKAAVIAAGYAAGAASPAVSSLVDAPLYDIYAASGLAGANEAATRANARALALAVAHSGLVVGLLAHNTGELSVDQWGWCLDEFAAVQGITVTSHQLAAATIRSSGLWTDDSDGSWSRAYADPDLRLRKGSPAIDVGADVGLTVDLAGRTVPQGTAPDLGAYEYKKSGAGLLIPVG